MPKVALVQMTSTHKLDANLRRMEQWIGEAAGQGAQIVAFPELAYLMGEPSQWLPVVAEYESLVSRFSALAKKHRLFLVPGSLREPVPGKADRYFNTLLVFDPEGAVRAKYRKLFLFQASLPDREYDERKHCSPGETVVTSELPLTTLGLSICFDVRFPELYRALKRRGTQIALIPSAFTVPTGMAHWETLVRARAIENQCFVVAPAQVGTVGEGREAYGHSLIVSPWGEVLVDMGFMEGLRVVDLPLDAIDEAAKRVAAWASVREDVLPLA